MTEYADILNAISRWFRAIDGKNWQAAESLMTTPFHLDYSSFGLGPAADVMPSDVIKGWAGFLPGFDATHHQLGNFDVSSDAERANVECYVTARHIITDAPGGYLWIVIGSYSITLIRSTEGWMLSGCCFHFGHDGGNRRLPSLARGRISSR